MASAYSPIGSTSRAKPRQDADSTEYYSAANSSLVATKDLRLDPPMTCPDGKHPATAIPPSGQLVFDSSMNVVKSRKLGPRSRSQKISLKALRQMGGACEKHKISKKKCHCHLGSKTPSSQARRSAVLKEELPSRSDEGGWPIDGKSPIPSNKTMITSHDLDGRLDLGLVENHTPPQQPLPNEAMHWLERTPVFSCPFPLTGCRFIALSCTEWSSHVERHQRAWEMQNNCSNGTRVDRARS